MGSRGFEFLVGVQMEQEATFFSEFHLPSVAKRGFLGLGLMFFSIPR